jgi:exosortase/archaeosortase family protein
MAAISVQLLWSRVLMLLFTRPIASLDAWLVGLILRQPVHGTTVTFVDGSHVMSILAACTSVENASVALVLFVAVARSFRPTPARSELLALAGVFLSVVAVNLARLALMGQNMAMFRLMHDGVGADVTNAVITTIGLAWAVGNVRREILR